MSLIYHGSDKIIEVPKFSEGKINNDFGLGFYCTKEKDMAKEWAVGLLKDGYCNTYTIDTKYLKILDLNSGKYNILNWIALLVEHRIFSINSPIVNRAKRYLIDNFSLNINAYDIIISYRADDSYFDYAEDFLSNQITINQLSLAMKLGKLGLQFVVKSKYAFSLLNFKESEKVKAQDFFSKRITREKEAEKNYNKILETEDVSSLFIQDIIKMGLKNGDKKIPKILPFKND